jgi:hypothetical protein
MPYFTFDTMDLDQCMILSLFVITKLFEGNLTLPSYDKMSQAKWLKSFSMFLASKELLIAYLITSELLNHLGGLLCHQHIVNDCS